MNGPAKLRLSPCGKYLQTDDGLKLNLTVCQLNPCGSFTPEEIADIANLLVNGYNLAAALTGRHHET